MDSQGSGGAGVNKTDIAAVLRLRAEIKRQQAALGFPYTHAELRAVMRYLLQPGRIQEFPREEE